MPSWNRSALIVDDQPFIGMVASDILQETGYDTYHASDASGARAMLRSHPEIGLLVTEADLSGHGDGVELTRTVSRERPDIQIVVTAGDGTSKTYAGGNFAAAGENGLPGEQVSVLGWSDTYDVNQYGHSVVATVQAYLLTGSGSCWVYESQTFTV